MIGVGVATRTPTPIYPGSLIADSTSEPIELPTQWPTQTPWIIEHVVTATPDPIPTLTPLPRFDLWQAKHVKITIGDVVIEFDPVHYYPGFDLDYNTSNGALWKDSHSNVGVWLHGGNDNAATPLQMSVELGEQGNRQYIGEVNDLLNRLPGTPALFDVDGVRFNLVLKKIARFPAWDVDFYNDNYANTDVLLGGEPIYGGVIIAHCVRQQPLEVKEYRDRLNIDVNYADTWDFGRLVWVFGG